MAMAANCFLTHEFCKNVQRLSLLLGEKVRWRGKLAQVTPSATGFANLLSSPPGTREWTLDGLINLRMTAWNSRLGQVRPGSRFVSIPGLKLFSHLAATKYHGPIWNL
jgi:hypothetical protein